MSDIPPYPPGVPYRLRALLRTIDRISVWSGKAFAWLTVPLMFALVYEVVSRYAFGAPTRWAFDITYMLYGSHFVLVAAYTLLRQEHIRTDFVYRMLSPRWQGIMDAALYLVLFLPGIAMFLWFTAEFAYESWVQLERSNLSPWLPPIYPLKTALPVGAALLFLQGLSEFIKSVYAARADSWQ